MDSSDTLGALISAPLIPLRPEQRSERYAAEIAEARARHDRDPDDYWAWVAEQHRWLRPYDTVRTGELGDFR
jgi:acetyl-CoA synthetase